MSASLPVAARSQVTPESPYKGLAPFEDSEVDALLFFGREEERDVIVANLLASRLSVLYGPSGVGKSSLLRAGVAHELRRAGERNLAEHGHPELAVATFANWTEDPVAGLRVAAAQALAIYFGDAAVAAPSEDASLADAFEAWTTQLGCELLLILDQAEEYFVYHEAEEGPGTFAEQLPELVTRSGLRVGVLLAIREDSLAKLDFFKARIPNLFANYLRLDHLDRAAGRRAIVGPIERYNEYAAPGEAAAIEPELVEEVLDDVEAGKVASGRRGRGVVRRQWGVSARVEAPYLQLVMQRIWETERADGSSVLRLETLRRLGGASRITEEHLERALAALTPTGRDIAAVMFHHLVTPSGTKIAHRTADLAQYAHIPEEDAAEVVRRLAVQRILRPVDGDQRSRGAAYEIFHDVLGDAVLAWRSRHETERTLRAERTRRRRAFQLAGVAIAALALMSAVAVYAIIQRSEARELANAARARELTARAFANVDFDPQRSLSLAVRAAGLGHDGEVEAVLRRALRNARLRRTIEVGAPVVAADYARDGSVVLGGENGVVVLVAPGQEPRRIVLGDESLVAAQFNPAGTQILAADESAAYVLDADTGRVRLRLPQAPTITSATIGLGGRVFTTTSTDGTAAVSRMRDGRRLLAVRGEGKALRASLAANGRDLAIVVQAAGGRVGAALYRGRRLVRLLPQRGLSDLEFTPDGRLLVTASRDGTAAVWRTHDGSLVRKLDDGGGALAAIDVSPDGTLLATASSDGGVRVWTLDGGGRLFYFVGHSSPATFVSFDRSGAYVVSGSEDRTARIWTVRGIEAGGDPALLIGHRRGVTAAAYGPSSTMLLTGSEDGKGRIWDARIEEALRVLARRFSVVERLALTPSGAIAERSGRVVAVHRGRRLLGSFRLAGALAEFSADGRYVASAAGRVLRVHRLPTGEVVAELDARSEIAALALRRDGREVVTLTVDGSVLVWDLSAQTVAARFRIGRDVARVALSPGGDRVIAARVDGTLRVLARGGRLLHALHGHPGQVTDIGFDPSGRRIVTAATGSSENLMTWDVRSGRRLHVLVGHFGTVTAASFSGDGRWIGSAGPIAGAVWPADGNRPFVYLRGPTDLLTDLRWSQNGYDIVVSARDRTVRAYTCVLCKPLSGLLEVARGRMAAAR